MGNIFGYITEPYTSDDEPVAKEKETESDDKNAYYWFGLRDGDIELYRLMENDET